MKKKLLIAMSYVLVAALAITGTLAFLIDTDEDVNVMTLGNVEIEQVEMERIEQLDANTAATNLKEFENNKPLYPAVYDEIAFVGNAWQNWPEGGSSNLFDDAMKNVQDKFVFVENTGKSEAYVRTWFAFEAGNFTVEEINNGLIHWNRNTDHWSWTDFSDDMKVEIDGVWYYLRVATYTGNAGTDHQTHVNGVLPSGETTRPSLLQVFLDKEAGNEDIAPLGESYEIKVFSQAIQTQGFESAEAALTAGFGAATAANHPWIEE